MSAASNWIGIQTGVHGFDSRTPHKPALISKLSEANIWFSSYDHLTDVGGAAFNNFLSERVRAFYLTRKKLEMDWSKWMVMKRGKVEKRRESMVASYRYLEVSNPGLQMIWSNECDVSCLYGTQASFQYIRSPGLYYSQAEEALRQLESCQPSSQNKWSVDEWMCCQIPTPGRSLKKPTTPNFRNRKIPRFDRNNPIISWGQKPLYNISKTKIKSILNQLILV